MSEPDLAAIAAELAAMAEDDQRVRAELAADGSLYNGYHPVMEAVHRRNAARLEEIVARIGWPGHPLVGRHAAWAAWLILQHAIGDPGLQRRGLGWLREAAERGDVPAVEVAMLEDRIAVFEGRPQRYATQFDPDDQGRLVPYPVADPAGVDDRRVAVGLPPLAETIRAKQALLAAEGSPGPSADRADRRQRYEAWLRRVGWRD